MTKTGSRTTDKNRWWKHKKYPNVECAIVRTKGGYTIRDRKGIINMMPEPRWRMIEILLNCGWKLSNKRSKA